MRKVPAHAGGVDLSERCAQTTIATGRPRPCGRGGFKPVVKHGVNGHLRVPAHAGGVDLSCINEIRARLGEGPRPCGRGGFKR